MGEESLTLIVRAWAGSRPLPRGDGLPQKKRVLMTRPHPGPCSPVRLHPPRLGQPEAIGEGAGMGSGWGKSGRDLPCRHWSTVGVIFNPRRLTETPTLFRFQLRQVNSFDWLGLNRPFCFCE